MAVHRPPPERPAASEAQRPGAPPEPTPLCPRCGATYEPDQEYCLECGLRLPAQTGLVATLGNAWRRRLPWYPGDWIWFTLLAAVVAALAGAGAAVWISHSKKSTAPTVIGTTEAVPQTTTAPTAPEQTTPTATLPTTQAPPPPPPPKTLAAWPAGRTGWTVVLASIPTTVGRADALGRARQALRAGLKQPGVLDSSRFSSLHPGYYVVFSGIYGSEEQAKAAASTAHARGFPAAYWRRITP